MAHRRIRNRRDGYILCTLAADSWGITMSYAAMIEERLRFLKIDETVIEDLLTAREILEPEMDGILDSFYAHISAEPHLKALFEDDAAMARAREAQKQHWVDSLMAGEFTSDHIDRAETIGRAHARVGLTPNWYIGGYSNMLVQFIKPVTKQLSEDGHDSSPVIEALCKAVMLDLDLVIQCYLEAKDRIILDLLMHATRFIDELAESHEELRSTSARLEASATELSQDPGANGGQPTSLSAVLAHANALSETVTKIGERIEELKSGDRLYLQRGTEHTGTFTQLVTQIIEE